MRIAKGQKRFAVAGQGVKGQDIAKGKGPDHSRAQNQVDQAWQNPEGWARASITNTMRCGFFSSDRAIEEYATRIWKLKPLTIGNAAP